MAKLEDLRRGAAVRGILADCLVTVVDVRWYGSAAVELTYKDPSGRPGVELLYRDREPTLEVVEAGRPWSFDGDGRLFRLVSEAQRINLAYLFDPLLAIHTSLVDPLPHQITAVYGEMLPRQPLRFLLADDPGALKTNLEGFALRVRRSGTDKKWEGLSSLLQNQAEMFDAEGHRRKLVIFTEHRDRLNYIAERLRALVTVHGGMGREERGKAAETARELAYRLYTLCERKGWAEEAGYYNSLVMAWPAMRPPELFQ